jgi:hypothetical protein
MATQLELVDADDGTVVRHERVRRLFTASDHEVGELVARGLHRRMMPANGQRGRW